jgi:hypothetical protein
MHDDLKNIKGAKERVDHKRIVEASCLVRAVIAVAVFFVIGGL